MEKPIPGHQKRQQATQVVNNEVVQQYQTIIARLADLRHTDLDLVSKYGQKTDQPRMLDEIQRSRQVRSNTDQPSPGLKRYRTPLREIAFVGAERDQAVALARERYRRQNDSGFSYNGAKKDFDTLVKEAEQELIKDKINKSLVYEASDDELARLTQLQKLNQTQIENLEKQRSELERRYPGLAGTLPSTSDDLKAQTAAERARLAAIANERARLAGLEAKTAALKSHFNDVRKETEQLAEVAFQIEQLERTKQIEENNYKYFQASLEKARVDEMLDPSKMPNISVVQSPSIAFKTSRELKKLVLGLAGGGMALGLGLAFLIDLVLDRKVKRPLEIEMLLGMPPMLSIPYFNRRKLRHGRLPTNSSLALWNHRNQSAAPWEPGHFIRTFCEAIRDRLILYFLLNRLSHRPKLVAVTGCSEGAGTSTIAAGLAAALSETGEGKVLIVDMNTKGPEVHPFFRGTPSCSLTEALAGSPAPAGENLYLAVAASSDSPEAQIIPKRFYDLVPHLKASDFDYIVFDMPPLSQTSVTLSIAGLMDKVLVIVEGEKSNRDFLKRAYAELIACRATVSVIFNKATSYAPRWLGAAA
jgi:polysaccharide biosynthesis transport protein